MTIEARKIYLIKRIMEIHDEAVLKQLEALAGDIPIEENAVLVEMVSPIQKEFDLEQIKLAQNFQPVDKAAFDELIAAADIQEPLEDLLAMI